MRHDSVPIRRSYETDFTHRDRDGWRYGVHWDHARAVSCRVVRREEGEAPLVLHELAKRFPPPGESLSRGGGVRISLAPLVGTDGAAQSLVHVGAFGYP
jgi:hypothetical protein